MADEWYTPEHIIEFITDVLGYIELDPCSSESANEIVEADRFWTIEDDSLTKEWVADTAYMNPPYSKPYPFVKMFRDAYISGNIKSGILLLKGDPSTKWFDLIRKYIHVWVPKRLKFNGPQAHSAPFPSVLVYLGDDENKFILECIKRRWVPLNQAQRS